MDEKQESNLTKEFRSLPQHVMDFLKSIDKDDTILVISDCGSPHAPRARLVRFNGDTLGQERSIGLSPGGRIPWIQ